MLRVKLFSLSRDGGYVTSDNYEVDFVSLVNSDTYGPPPLVAPEKGQPPVARIDDQVLYVNTDLVPAWIIERLDDGDD